MAWDRTTEELLESLLAGEELTPNELDEMLRNRVPEDLFLDYKDGKVLNQPKKERNALIRQYVAGFANSLGGVLVIGVDQNTWAVSPCNAGKVSGDLVGWVSDCLTEIAYYLSPAPRVHVVDHPGGAVLVIATARMPNLVSCTVGKELVYYLRFHDQTLCNKTLGIPEYLVADLMLGRRQHPNLQITSLDIICSAPPLRPTITRVTDPIDVVVEVTAGLTLRTENTSLVWATDAQLGLIGYTRQQASALSSNLRSYIDLNPLPNAPDSLDQLYNPAHWVRSLDADPFKVEERSIAGLCLPRGFSLPRIFHQYTWCAACYLVSRGSAPIWYQIEVDVDNHLHSAASRREGAGEFRNSIRCRRVTGRPVVGWDSFERV